MAEVNPNNVNVDDNNVEVVAEVVAEVEAEAEAVVDKSQLTTRQKVVVGSFVASIVAEIVLNKREFLWTPSHVLRTVSTSCLDVFSATGSQLVNGSKVIAEYISIKDVAVAIYNLLTPIGYLLVSPYNMFVGISNTVQVDKVTAMIGLGTTSVLGVIALLIAERRSGNSFKPSNVLSNVYKRAWQFYDFVGRIAADVSSIYRVLRLDRVVDDATKIADPVVRLLIAPVKSVTGYFKEIDIRSYATAKVILAGTITIASLFAYGYSLARS